MRVCTSTCPECGRKFNRYSGYLLNISDSCIGELKSRVQYNKHVVLCSDCIARILGRNLVVGDFKFKGNLWYTSNIVWLLRKRLESGRLSEDEYQKEIAILKSLDNKGVSSYKVKK